MSDVEVAGIHHVQTVAVLSDVHGVLPVLQAVLAEPDVAAADLIVVTGDHAAGPQPVQVLDTRSVTSSANAQPDRTRRTTCMSVGVGTI